MDLRTGPERLMPRYFIDTDDGDLRVEDEDGHDLSGPHAARLIALDVLPDMARDKLPDGERRAFRAAVRGEDGQLLYTASLSFVGEWQFTPRPS